VRRLERPGLKKLGKVFTIGQGCPTIYTTSMKDDKQRGSGMKPKSGDTITVWFSCGAASAVAAHETLRLYGDQCDIRIVNNPVAEEDKDNVRFLRDVEQWLGVKIETATNTKYPNASAVEVWEARAYMSGIAGAPCTQELKKKARQQWERVNSSDWIVLGFTADEKNRHDNFVLSERGDLLPVLIDQGITKGDCYNFLLSEGLILPRIYRLGYPNANCIGCVKATSSTYWNHVRGQHPEVFQHRAEMSRRLGARLVRVNGERVFLDELDPNAEGRPMKNMDFECGIFCEETPMTDQRAKWARFNEFLVDHS